MPLPASSRRRPAALAALLALALAPPLACDAGRVLELVGVPTLAEIGFERFAEELGTGEPVRIVQRGARDESLRPLPGALVLADDALPPADWREAPGPVRVVAGRPEDALALAARLRRAGIGPVAVVRAEREELAALGEPRTARAAQPAGSRDHPSTRGARQGRAH